MKSIAYSIQILHFLFFNIKNDFYFHAYSYSCVSLYEYEYEYTNTLIH